MLATSRCANLLTTEAVEVRDLAAAPDRPHTAPPHCRQPFLIWQESDLAAAKKTLRFVDLSSNRLCALPGALAELHTAEARASHSIA
jgi:hypothetical protein